jgi:hypothetical protein
MHRYVKRLKGGSMDSIDLRDLPEDQANCWPLCRIPAPHALRGQEVKEANLQEQE